MYTVSLLDRGENRNSVSDALPNYTERVVEHCYSFACNKSDPKIMSRSHLPRKLRDLRQAHHESWRACRKSSSFQDLVTATQHWYSVRAASVTLAQHCVSAVQMSPAKLFLFEGSKFLDTRKRVFLCFITWHWVSLWWRCWEVAETGLLYTWAHTTRTSSHPKKSVMHAFRLISLSWQTMSTPIFNIIIIINHKQQMRYCTFCVHVRLTISQIIIC